MKDIEKKILERLKAGKSYTDIIVELGVHPPTIAIVKKKYLNKQEPKTEPGSPDGGGESKYFGTKYELYKYLETLGYKGTFWNSKYEIGTPNEVRIKLQKYILTRISHREYKLELGGVI